MSFFQPAGTAAVRRLTRRRERSGPCCLRQGPFFFAQRGVRARPAALANMRRSAAPTRPRRPTCAGLPRPPGRARRHAPVLPRPPCRARRHAPVCRARPAGPPTCAGLPRLPGRAGRHAPVLPRPPAGLCLSPWKAEKYAPAKYIYKRAAALQPGRCDCNGHFLETSLQIQLAVV